MKKQVSSAQAKNILKKVPLNVSFWLCTSDQLCSIEQLSSVLKKVNDEVFRYHVSKEKNDFEKWIRETIGDKELSREISRIKTRQTLIRKLEERVEELRKIIKKDIAKKGSKKKPLKKVRKIIKKKKGKKIR